MGQVRPAFAALTMVFVACDRPDASLSYERRDSVGVEIVVSHRPRLDDPNFGLLGRPVLRLGVAAGQESQEFAVVSDAAALDDGSVAVLDSGNDEVRVFDPEGELRARFGGAGEGPGEFRFAFSIEAVGERLVVMDRSLARLTWFSLSGEVHEIRSLEEVVGSDAAFEIAHLEGDAILSLSRRPETRRVVRTTADAQLVEFDGEVRIEWEDARSVFVGPAAQFTEIGGVGVVVPPFQNRVHVAGRGVHAYVGTNDRFEVRVFDRSGRLQRIVRYPQAEESLREDEVRTLSDSIRSMGGPDFQAAYDPVLQPKTRPVFNQLEASKAGWLWVGRYAYGLGFTRAWWVFAPSGELVAEVVLPEAVDILDVRDDVVVWRVVGPRGEHRVEVVPFGVPDSA